MSSIQKKMDKLKEEKAELLQEIEENEKIGKQVRHSNVINYLIKRFVCSLSSEM